MHKHKPFAALIHLHVNRGKTHNPNDNSASLYKKTFLTETFDTNIDYTNQKDILSNEFSMKSFCFWFPTQNKYCVSKKSVYGIVFRNDLEEKGGCFLILPSLFPNT